ncbi:hypothetical protein A2U01_0099381, partial [Trifolium medium]|nr:hypothetical protein [Trifolium medium]
KFSSMKFVVAGNASEVGGRYGANELCLRFRESERDNCERGERRPVAVGRDGRIKSGERWKRERLISA